MIMIGKSFLAMVALSCAACGGGTTPAASTPPTSSPTSSTTTSTTTGPASTSKSTSSNNEWKTLTYDAAKIPKGTGWQCYVVTPSTGATLSSCFRDSAACEGAQKKAAGEGKDPASVCGSAKQSFCVTYAEGSESNAHCSKSKDDCERWRVAQGEKTSRCTEEP